METTKGLLFDSTLCVGCGACYLACKERNHLPKTTSDFLKDDLSERTYSVVQKRNNRYIRRLCMHCKVPTCVSVCPVGALEKTSTGPVIYHEDRCIGCRYCMQACPFNIPRYEWSSALPLVRKCDMCADRQKAGLATACATVCPTKATTYGDRDALIQEARERLAAHPERYVNRIYGLEEVGGTSVLILAGVGMETLGYPDHVSHDPLPLLTWNVLQHIPNFVMFGAVLLGGVWWITNRRFEVETAERNHGNHRDNGSKADHHES